MYTEPFSNHFLYRHAVDDHNNLRHSVPSIESTWITSRWPSRVFSFILAIVEVNCYLIFKYFVWKNEEKLTLHQFRKKLALQLIENIHLTEETEERLVGTRSRSENLHEFLTAPKHARKCERRIWDLTATAPYQQYVCRGVGCKRQVRTYCSCTPGHWLCSSCYSDHVVEALSADRDAI